MKILILGTSCSGKTTLAKRVSELLNIYHIELDELLWNPNWTLKSKDEFHSLLKSQLDQNNSWVICGNCTKDEVSTEADIIVWLNYPFLKILYRALKRSFFRLVTKTKCCNGNTETLSQTFSKDSIIVWICKTYKKRKREYRSLINSGHFNRNKFYEITNQHSLKAFMVNLSQLK